MDRFRDLHEDYRLGVKRMMSARETLVEGTKAGSIDTDAFFDVFQKSQVPRIGGGSYNKPDNGDIIYNHMTPIVLDQDGRLCEKVERWLDEYDSKRRNLRNAIEQYFTSAREQYLKVSPDRIEEATTKFIDAVDRLAHALEGFCEWDREVERRLMNDHLPAYNEASDLLSDVQDFV